MIGCAIQIAVPVNVVPEEGKKQSKFLLKHPKIKHVNDENYHRYTQLKIQGIAQIFPKIPGVRVFWTKPQRGSTIPCFIEFLLTSF